MIKLSYLILSIICAFLSDEILAVSDDESSSSNPQKHQTHTDESPSLPRYVPVLGEVSPINEIEMSYPTIVDIMSLDDKFIGHGYAIHNLFVVTRPEYVCRPYYIKLTVGDKSGKHYEKARYERTFAKVIVIQVPLGISLARPVHKGLEKAGYSEAAIKFACDIVKNWMKNWGHPVVIL